MKILKTTVKNCKKIDKLPKIWLVACWARYGAISFPFSGKYVKKTILETNQTIDVPLVWMYNDHNGTTDQFELVPIDWTTTGGILIWTQDEAVARRIAEKFNQK